MIRRIVILLFIFLAVNMGGEGPHKAYACSCADPGIERRFESSSVVFSGTLVSKDMAGGNVFDVDRAWKGKLADGYVFSGFFGMCGTEFEIGKRYLVFAENLKGTESTSLCSGNMLLADASEELEELDRLAGTGRGGAVYGGAALLAIAAAVALLLLWRRRRGIGRG